MTILNDGIASTEADRHLSFTRCAMNDFSSFLDHVMKNFSASFPYGLSKTEVTRLTFLAWCMREAHSVKEGLVEVKS
jgi:hypothetical protein